MMTYESRNKIWKEPFNISHPKCGFSRNKCVYVYTSTHTYMRTLKCKQKLAK